MSTPDTLPALDSLTGEQIRVLCAEKFGWKSPNHPDSLSKRDGWWSKHRGIWWINTEGKDCMISDVPRYTESADAALLLVAWMSEHKGLCWDGYTNSNGKVYFRFRMNHPEGNEKYSSAATFALAICRSFLSALGMAR